MANGSDKNESQGAIWDRLHQQSDLIGELARNQAHTEAQLAALATSVETGFNQITQNLNRVIERDSKPTNWFAAISALIVVGGAILTFNALQTDPVRSRAIENASRVNDVLERELVYAEMHGEVKARLEVVEEELHELQEFERRAQYELGKLDALKQKLDEVDLHGSRRWVDDK